MLRNFWILLILLFPLPAFADLYVYKDRSGIVHYTNVTPKKASARKVGRQPLQPTAKLETTRPQVEEIGRASLGRRNGNLNRYDPIIEKAAKYYTLPFALVKAVIAAESGFQPQAISPVGAQGLMQLMPGTAQDMGVGNSFDPEQNILGGARYLRILANRFSGNLRHILAGYNAGPEAVERNSGIPPYFETQMYVKRVLELYRHYQEKN
jgi:hypothetical protein